MDKIKNPVIRDAVKNNCTKNVPWLIKAPSTITFETTTKYIYIK